VDRGGPDGAGESGLSSRCPEGRPDAATAALLTPPGRGALAIVGVRGPAAAAIVSGLFLPRGKPLASWEAGRIGVGAWRGIARGAIAAEEVVVVRTDDGWEIHGHGGHAAPEAILDDLRRAGADIVEPAAWGAGGFTAGAGIDSCGDWRGDWGGDAGGNSGACPSAGLSAEAVPLFPRVRGPRAAAILCRQVSGRLATALTDLERLVAGGRGAAAGVLAGRLLTAARVGLRLGRPWRVVVVGRVNAGKSALVNALAGHARCIVSAEPGTTRDAVETAIVLGGWEVVLVDTAGTPGPDGRTIDGVERAGVVRAGAALEEADLVLRVADVDEDVPEVAACEIAVRSKADLAPVVPPPGGLAISALTGAGIDDLAAAIVRRLVPEDAADPSLLQGAVPFLPRHVALVRRILAAREGQ